MYVCMQPVYRFCASRVTYVKVKVTVVLLYYSYIGSAVSVYRLHFHSVCNVSNGGVYTRWDLSVHLPMYDDSCHFTNKRTRSKGRNLMLNTSVQSLNPLFYLVWSLCVFMNKIAFSNRKQHKDFYKYIDSGVQFIQLMYLEEAAVYVLSRLSRSATYHHYKIVIMRKWSLQFFAFKLKFQRMCIRMCTCTCICVWQRVSLSVLLTAWWRKTDCQEWTAKWRSLLTGLQS